MSRSKIVHDEWLNDKREHAHPSSNCGIHFIKSEPRYQKESTKYKAVQVLGMAHNCHWLATSRSITKLCCILSSRRYWNRYDSSVVRSAQPLIAQCCKPSCYRPRWHVSLIVVAGSNWTAIGCWTETNRRTSASRIFNNSGQSFDWWISDNMMAIQGRSTMY